MSKKSTLTIYSVPYNVKLLLFKTNLFENITSGITVRDYKNNIKYEYYNSTEDINELNNI